MARNRLLSASYKASENTMAEASKSFYQAFRLLPKETFEGVTALYAYNRYVDDIADSGDLTQEEALGKLDDLEAQILNIKMSEEEPFAWWLAFKDTVSTYQVSTDALLKQIQGQRMDILGYKVVDMADLVAYASNVAGSVGEMLLPLLVDKDTPISETLRQAAIDLGIGMQLTNILRDVGEDYRDRQRIYLPQTLLDAYNVDEAMIKRLSYHDEEEIPQNFIDLWEHIYQVGDQYYDSIKPVIKDFSQVAQLPILSSAYIYHGIGNAVRKANHNCFTKRNYTNNIERMRLIYQARKVLKDI
ncbi:phytoene/squalene synthase family protein [Aerococcus urinaeequi]|uniref:Phytoene/squalene synthase family protein n=1 Tax=Aerococcus urinaeequi TaxID=51665 RepID=A0AAF0BIL5_9LACT|nr:phytoene/squalene synthase family protein [Aerococcus urinaeequi]WCG37247.1 phytoene/squalene synthase family protein [Aerococcus urinaeequi]